MWVQQGIRVLKRTYILRQSLTYFHAGGPRQHIRLSTFLVFQLPTSLIHSTGLASSRYTPSTRLVRSFIYFISQVGGTKKLWCVNPATVSG